MAFAFQDEWDEGCTTLGEFLALGFGLFWRVQNRTGNGEYVNHINKHVHNIE